MVQYATNLTLLYTNLIILRKPFKPVNSFHSPFAWNVIPLESPTCHIICLNWARENGIKYMRVNSGIGRVEAHKFYKHMGYESEKEQLRFIKKI